MLAIEVGGSSVQTTRFADDGSFQGVPLSDHKDETWAFAASAWSMASASKAPTTLPRICSRWI